MAGEEGEGRSLLEHGPRGLRVEPLGPAGQLVGEAADRVGVVQMHQAKTGPWYADVYGLSTQLVGFAIRPTLILVAVYRLGEWGYLWWRSRPLEAVFRRPRVTAVASD